MTVTRGELDELGPIDYLVVEFPGSRMTGKGLPMLVDLVDRGIIRSTWSSSRRTGRVGARHGHRRPGQGRPAGSRRVRGSLLRTPGPGRPGRGRGALEPGSSAGILVYENRWAAPLAREIRRGDGQLVASGRIPVQAVLAALDAAEASD